MNSVPPAPESVPMLTEVVHWAPSAGPDPLGVPLRRDAAAADEATLTERVLATLQCQIGPALDARLHAAIAPALARAAEQVVHETRLALVRTLRDLVAGAVAQELARSLPNAASPAELASDDQRLA